MCTKTKNATCYGTGKGNAFFEFFFCEWRGSLSSKSSKYPSCFSTWLFLLHKLLTDQRNCSSSSVGCIFVFLAHNQFFGLIEYRTPPWKSFRKKRLCPPLSTVACVRTRATLEVHTIFFSGILHSKRLTKNLLNPKTDLIPDEKSKTAMIPDEIQNIAWLYNEIYVQKQRLVSSDDFGLRTAPSFRNNFRQKVLPLSQHACIFRPQYV